MKTKSPKSSLKPTKYLGINNPAYHTCFSMEDVMRIVKRYFVVMQKKRDTVILRQRFANVLFSYAWQRRKLSWDIEPLLWDRDSIVLEVVGTYLKQGLLP